MHQYTRYPVQSFIDWKLLYHDKNEKNGKKDKYTMSDIVNSSIQDSTREKYYPKYNLFVNWLTKEEEKGYPVPYIDDLRNNIKLFELVSLMSRYLVYRFNETHNIGNSLANELDAILHGLREQQVFLARANFPFITRFIKGCNLIAQRDFGKRVEIPKYAILNPQLEQMLKIVNDDIVKIAMLFQHRFVLRAEHITVTNINSRIIKLKNLAFNPNREYPKSLIITTYSDKNHVYNHRMVRTCRCTCNSPWTCVVHTMSRFLHGKWNAPEIPVISYHGGKPLQYNRYLKIVQAVITDMKLDPKNYGTHSMRSGGACEMFCEGRRLQEIKMFGQWRSIESVDAYMHPYNPDMNQFIPDFEYYRKMRHNEYARAMFDVDLLRKQTHFFSH